MVNVCYSGAFLYSGMYVCTYVHMYIRMYVHIYVCTYICMYVRTYVCKYMYICLYPVVRVNVHATYVRCMGSL